VAEVRVNTSTGKTELLHVTAAHDVGRILNPVGFEGQVCGGVAQGFGYALLEDFNIEHGQVKSENFDSYLLPTIKDIPRITVIGVETPILPGRTGRKASASRPLNWPRQLSIMRSASRSGGALISCR
jgi:CO/xanthine dehydrogenase Mo-binding subunit